MPTDRRPSEQFQVPSNLLLSKSKPSLYLVSQQAHPSEIVCQRTNWANDMLQPFWMCVWGVVSGCTAAVQSYHGLVTVRFILGIVEAPFFPGAIFLVSVLLWLLCTRRQIAFSDKNLSASLS